MNYLHRQTHSADIMTFDFVYFLYFWCLNVDVTVVSRVRWSFLTTFSPACVQRLEPESWRVSLQGSSLSRRWLLCQRDLFPWAGHRCRITTLQNRKWLYFPASCWDGAQGCLLAPPPLPLVPSGPSFSSSSASFPVLAALLEGKEGLTVVFWQWI